MVNEKGEPVIIDPAVYYGHREMDLGMSQLFGGFDNRFYETYHKNYPLEPGWQERMDYCNLYPLMVHVNLFGGGYAGSVKSILRRF
jgi:fructosamine-3-kinase